MLNLKSVLRSATLRQSSVTLVGTVINGLLGAVFYVLGARVIGPVEFGLLTLAITTLTLVADIADLGTNTGLVKFVSKHLKSDSAVAYRFLKLSLVIKLIVYGVVVVVGWLMAPWLAEVVFAKSELLSPLRLAFIGVGGAMLFSLTTAALQAQEKFMAWSGLNIAMNSLRVGLLLGLIALSMINSQSALLIYILMPFLGFVVGWWLLPVRQILRADKITSVAREFYQFNRWVALFVMVAAISSRLDIFLAGRYLSSNELGIYGASNQLAGTISQLVAALGVVVAPKFSSFDSQLKMLDYWKKSQWLVLGISGLMLIGLPLSIWLLPLLYGVAYSGMVPIFMLLVISGLIFLISVPIHNSLIYYFGRSDIFVWVAVGNLVIVGILGWYLVQIWGAIGLALAVGTGTTFNLVVPAIWWWRLVKR